MAVLTGAILFLIQRASISVRSVSTAAAVRLPASSLHMSGMHMRALAGPPGLPPDLNAGLAAVPGYNVEAGPAVRKRTVRPSEMLY
jgi:hypothetical protein